jgi:hypothetical protein
MRSEYKKLSDEKGAKEREWYSKMAGFYNGSKLDKIEVKDAEDTLLRQKVER